MVAVTGGGSCAENIAEGDGHTRDVPPFLAEQAGSDSWER